MNRAFVLVALLCTSCSTYGWANRAGTPRVERPVAVRTVDVDAHSGADAAVLTRQLVAELLKAGVTAAQWTGGGQSADVVECDIALTNDTGFGDNAYVEISTVCAVDGEMVSTRQADAQLALTAEDRTLGRRRAVELAARRTLPAVARDIATHLANEH